MALALRGRRLVALAAAAAAVLPIAQVAPWYFGGTPTPDHGAGPPVKLLVSNVNYGNQERGRILRLIANEDPDIVGLVEVNLDWQRSLGALRVQYPHFHEVPGERHLGLGLYSRLPLANARALRLPHSELPAIAATVATPGGEVEFILVHLTPPISATLVRRRNQQALQLARHVREQGQPTVVAGDFNITMWNRGYRPLENTGGLANARAGHGVGPTWPAPWQLGVPIDHVLATDGVKLRDFRVLRPIGSDHLPVAAGFSVRK